MKNNKTFIVIAIALPLLFILIYLLSTSSKKKINWEENYKGANKDPFGSYVIFELLKDLNKEKEIETITSPLYKNLKFSTADSGNYVFIGNDLYLSDKDLDSLLKFVNIGNTAFIASKNFPAKLMDTLLTNKCSTWEGHYSRMDSMATMNFNHLDLYDSSGYKFITPNKGPFIPKQYNWQGINGNYFCDSIESVIHLGYIKEKDTGTYVNFIKVPYGSGSFLFHTNPVVFSNYYLKDKRDLEYTEKAISHLNHGRIYWDEHSKLPSYQDQGENISGGPLKLILANESLKFAWYLLLLLVILYIIFFAKRKQRIIPIIEQNVNTSLEFIKTVGLLYFQQNNHRKLMHLKLKLFLNFIRQRYHLPTNTINDDLVKKISLKSNISIEDINNIIQETEVIKRYDIPITANDLIRLHNSLDFFYKNCK
jgi:hypothetical protein